MISHSQLMQWETEIAHKDAIIAELRAELAAAEDVVQAVKDLRTSDQLGAVEPPNNTPFYILTVKSHEKLLEAIAAYDALQGKDKP